MSGIRILMVLMPLSFISSVESKIHNFSLK